ncbi:helix-turn-helix domain-containing protein [Flavobacterium enshiense]|uniref:helix-turn-helix domain-containing protein n=1 Tax=Flavobacterium enshiense TaxID=1341165 RepID=UPI00345D488E
MKKFEIEGINADEFKEILSQQVKAALEHLLPKASNLNNDSDELLTREEAMAFLKIESSTLWRWTNSGRIIAYGIGHSRYYKKKELLQALIPLKVKSDVE